MYSTTLLCKTDANVVSLDAPSVTAVDTTYHEGKHDRLTPPKDLDVLEDSKETEPGGEDGAASSGCYLFIFISCPCFSFLPLLCPFLPFFVE